jgi:hypothetical protein
LALRRNAQRNRQNGPREKGTKDPQSTPSLILIHEKPHIALANVLLSKSCKTREDIGSHRADGGNPATSYLSSNLGEGANSMAWICYGTTTKD